MSTNAVSVPLSASSKRWTLVACILGSGIVFLDGTVVNVALPAIQRDLGASLASQQWVVEAYLLTLSSLLLLGGSLDDLFERRTVFVWGVASFGACSALCAAAPNVEFLIAARALQGIAGALLVPSTLAIIMSTFREDERGAAIGSWTAWTGIATVVGPLAGGLLIDSISWRLIFVLNIPLVLFTLALTARHVPRSDSHQPGVRVDFLGGLLCALGLGGVVFALIEQPRLGWGSPAVAASGLGGIAALGLFVAHERRTRDPMLPLELFRSRNFAVGNLATLTMYAGLGGGLFFLGLFLQQVRGYSALAAGAAFLPITALMFTLSRRMGGLADKFGPRLFMGVGPLIAGAGLGLLLRIGTSVSYTSQLLPALVVFGLGLSLTVAPLTATVLGAVDQRHSGVASGVNNAIARVAGLIAIAALGAVVAGRFQTVVNRDLAGVSLSPRAQAAVRQARARPLSTISANGLAGREHAIVFHALDHASVSAFRLGIGLTSGLVVMGGLVSLVGIQNPRRKVRAEECPGGAICGASRDVAEALPATEPAPEPA
ncbi:MAG TPA: MFS transporter [Solirubrobacteraceae bacterium]|jgi:EmrB/QacA subfamily drug resistance transporter|nr:MFS transporter [Solirubrobacteraceae bacterium]